MKCLRRVVIEQLPEKLTEGKAQFFLHDLMPILLSNRTQLVLDGSRLTEIDSAGVGVLLRCLEEVLKGNGDVKLAALSHQATVVLELTRVYSLFEVFGTTADAVESFHLLSGLPSASAGQTGAQDSLAAVEAA